MRKVCTKCELEKDLKDFYRDAQKRDGHDSFCKNCRKKYYDRNKKAISERKKKRYEKDKDAISQQSKKYYEENKEHILQRQKKYYRENREQVLKKGKTYSRQYYQENRDRRIQKNKEWYEQNKEGYLKKKKQYRTKRYKEDLEFRLASTVRSRVANALTGRASKSNKTFELVGCSIDELKVHLEEQFKEGMGWENYGRKGWHIDHIRPCTSFDLTDPNQQKQCFHYTNLQPLWAEDNLRKNGYF